MQKLGGSVEHRVASLVYMSASRPEPLNDALDRDKVAELMADMLEHGWQGPPIVVDEDRAVTGSHRLEARTRLWNDDGVDIDLPEVLLAEVCGEFGVDWSAHLDHHVDRNPADGWYEAVRTVDALLPRDVVDYLGLDAH